MQQTIPGFDGVILGVTVGVAVPVGVIDGVSVLVGVILGVIVGVTLGSTAFVGVTLGVIVGVTVAVIDGVVLGVIDGVAVTVAVIVGVIVGVILGVAVGVGVGDAATLNGVITSSLVVLVPITTVWPACAAVFLNRYVTRNLSPDVHVPKEGLVNVKVLTPVVPADCSVANADIACCVPAEFTLATAQLN